MIWGIVVEKEIEGVNLAMSTARDRKNEARQELEVPGTSANLGGLQYQILTLISEKNYEEAESVLKAYQDKKKYYPSYAKRTTRLFTHTIELVMAIKHIKSLPNFASLAQSKQDELSSKAREHWEELKVCLRRVKTIEKDLDLEDARSTIWVVKAFFISVMVVFVAFIIHEAFLSLGVPTKVVLDDLMKFLWSFAI